MIVDVKTVFIELMVIAGQIESYRLKVIVAQYV